jgi:FkbM family methyltransferase
MKDMDVCMIKIGGKRAYLRKNIPDDVWVFESIFYANNYLRRLKLRKDDVVLDVGANIGLFTLSIYDKVKQVIAIEPEPENFDLLKHTIIQNKIYNVIPINKAVGESKGFVSFSKTGATASAIDSKSGIELDTLDNILNDLGSDPTVVKMDIEGYEGKALRGFSKVKSVREIIMEVHSKSLQKEVIDILSSYGFKTEILHDSFISNIFLNIIKHPFTFIKVEKIVKYDTSSRYLRYLLHLSRDVPVEIASIKVSSPEIIILYAYR